MAGKRKRRDEESDNEDESDSEIEEQSENENDSENESNSGDEGGAGGSDDEGGDEGSGNEESGDDNDDDDNDDDDSDNKSEDSDEPISKRRKTVAKAKPAATKKKAATKTSSKTKSVKKAKAKIVKKKTSKVITKTKSGKKKEITMKTTTTIEKKIKIKGLKKIERLEEARKAYKWWEAPKLASGINWISLEHPGLYFPPGYQPHGIPLLYKGEEMILTPDQEEMVTFYAAMPDDGPQLGNVKTRTVFQKNFFDDFKEILGNNHKITRFEDCDFTLIKKHLDMQKNLRKVASDSEKAIKKEEKDRLNLKYGYALIDGRLEKVLSSFFTSFLGFFYFFCNPFFLPFSPVSLLSLLPSPTFLFIPFLSYRIVLSLFSFVSILFFVDVSYLLLDG
jgi:chromatin segregation and condensation protein Rec8/ScpA/Scc1 (kleisin family)